MLTQTNCVAVFTPLKICFFFVDFPLFVLSKELKNEFE